MIEGSEETVERTKERSWNGPGKASLRRLTQKFNLDLHGDRVVRSSESPEAPTIHHLPKAEDVEEVGKVILRPIADPDLSGPTRV